MDLVFPVPVAPAMSPCLFTVASGIFTCTPVTGCLSYTAPPNVMALPEKANAGSISCLNLSAAILKIFCKSKKRKQDEIKKNQAMVIA
jgi:hypothetical protein